MKKIVTILGITLLAMTVVVVAIIAAYEIVYRERVYPGIRIINQDLGGMDRNQILAWLSKKTGEAEVINLKWGVNEWRIPMTALGLNYDKEQTTERLLEIGRGKSWNTNIGEKINALTQGITIDLSVDYDPKLVDEAIASISGEINIPAKEPEIIKSGTLPEIVISAGENGQEINIRYLKQKINRALRTLDNNKIEIPVTELKPRLSDEQMEKAKSEAENLIGRKLVISFEEGTQKWELNDEELLTWINLPTGNWNRPVISHWVEELAQAVNRHAQDASFRWIGLERVEEFKPALEGVEVNIAMTVRAIEEALDNIVKSKNDQTAELITNKIKPSITNEEVNNLGIKELIGKGESWFTGSITNRIFNLKKAAEMLDGRLVGPGETFSFNEIIGEISADTGYKQAYIIKEGKTILGDGGGVCQVSTTLFRAALNAGLPIIARTAHAYRVSYYEVNYQVGFDATVFQPAPDFKFSNDTQNYLLIQMVYDEKKKYLSFEIYGTSDGRKAEISKARTWEVVAPPPDLYIDDPNLPAGKVVQTEHAARGAKVAFDWKVTRGEEVLQERTFFSNYRPWQAVYLRGTKGQ